MVDLVEDAKAGSEEAYSKIMILLKDELTATAYNILNNKSDVDDVVQEAFIKAFANLHKLKEPQYFKTWITRIVINLCKDQNQKEREKEEIEEIFKNHLTYTIDDISKVGKVEFKDNEILNILSNEEKEIIILYYDRNFTTLKISQKLNMNENTVKSHLHRARKKILDLGKDKTLSALTIVLIIAVLLSSTITLGARIIETLKEKITIFPIVFETKVDEFVQEVKDDYVYDKDVGIKVDSIAIDNKLLYISYLLDIKEDVVELDFDGFNITDNDNNLLAVGISNNINQTGSKDYSSGGLAYISVPTKTEDEKFKIETVMQVIYNKDYPLSKKININIDKISMVIDGKRKTLEGNWNFEIELDNKFNKRNFDSYGYTENEKIKNINTKLNDMSLEIEILLNEDINLGVVDTNNIILEDENGNIINAYSKIVNKHQKKITYICDLGKSSENSKTLHLYMKYDNGIDKFIDVTLYR